MKDRNQKMRQRGWMVIGILPILMAGAGHFEARAENSNGKGIHLLSVTTDLWSAGRVVDGTGTQAEITGSFDGRLSLGNGLGLQAMIQRPALPATMTAPTPTGTPTSLPSHTRTITPSATPTPTVSFTPSRTLTPSATPTPTVSFTPSRTLTPDATTTCTPTVTVSPTRSSTLTLSPSQTLTPTVSPRATETWTPTATSSWTLTPTPTQTLTVTPSPSPTDTFTPLPTASITFTATATSTPMPPDDDGDGIPSLVEDSGPNGGDSNGDGVADSSQPEVVGFPNVVDGRYLSLIAPPDSELKEVVSVQPTSESAQLPEGATAPYGLLHFVVDGVSSKSPFLLTLLVPDDTEGFTYWKYGCTPDKGTPHWYEFEYDGITGAQMSGRIVTLWFLDSGRGDDDLTVNKVLVDLGAPVREGSSAAKNWSLYW